MKKKLRCFRGFFCLFLLRDFLTLPFCLLLSFTQKGKDEGAEIIKLILFEQGSENEPFIPYFNRPGE